MNGVRKSGTSEVPIENEPRRAAIRPGEDRRLLQRMGPVSLGVSLPRAWVERHTLRLGSTVRVRPADDGSIRIEPVEGPSEGRECRIEVEPAEPPEHLFRRLVGAYLAGASRFELVEAEGISPGTRGILRLFTGRTLRPEIVSESATRIELIEPSDPLAAARPGQIARMGARVQALQESAIGRLAPSVELSATPMETQDDEIDRQAWYLERTLARWAREGIPPPSEFARYGLLGGFTIVRSLERIADHAVEAGGIGEALAGRSVPAALRTQLTQLEAEAHRHLGMVLAALATPDAGRANELLDLGAALRATVAALTERIGSAAGEPIGPAAAALLARLLHAIDRSIAYAQDIAEVILATPGALGPAAAGAVSGTPFPVHRPLAGTTDTKEENP